MGSGLVYAAVGLVWIWYAASRVGNVRAERRSERESAAHARVVRRALVPGGPAELETGGPGLGSRPADDVEAPVSVDGSRVRRSQVVPGAVPPIASRSAHRTAVRRRRRVLAVLAVASVALGASAALGYLPVWAALPAPVLCLAHLAAGARASRRWAARAAAAGRAAGARADVAGEADDPSWAGVPYVDVVADWCRTVPTDSLGSGAGSTAGSTAGVAAGPAGGPAVSAAAGPAVAVDELGTAAADTAAERAEAARLRSASSPAVLASGSEPGSWRAVPVPLPTYVTAPRVARTVGTIDLGSAGAWTSGRSAPPPFASPVARADRASEQRLAGSDPVEPRSVETGVAAGVAVGAPGPAVDGVDGVDGVDADENTEAIEFPHAASA